MEKKMRLDKYLATYTDFSRKEAKKVIRAGRVLYENEKILKEDIKIDILKPVLLDGMQIEAEQYVYYMLNKPAGVLSATKDKTSQTVVDLITDNTREIFPIGRLDKDTEGLLFLTDDGELCHQLLSPVYHVSKRYYVEYDGILNEDSISCFVKGLDIGEKNITKPARLELPEEGRAFLTITEGKFHQVKRMFAKVGGCVNYLKRVEMAGILLDDSLSSGEYRRLSETEINQLRESVRKNHG